MKLYDQDVSNKFLGLDTRYSSKPFSIDEDLRIKHLGYLQLWNDSPVNNYRVVRAEHYPVISSHHVMCHLLCFPSTEGNIYAHVYPMWAEMYGKNLETVERIQRFADINRPRLGSKVYTALQMSNHKAGGLTNAEYVGTRIDEIFTLSSYLEDVGLELQVLPIHNTMHREVSFSIDQGNIVCWGRDWQTVLGCFDTPKYEEEL